MGKLKHFWWGLASRNVADKDFKAVLKDGFFKFCCKQPTGISLLNVKAALVLHVHVYNYCQLLSCHTSVVNKQEHLGLKNLNYLEEKHFLDLLKKRPSERNEFNIQWY